MLAAAVTTVATGATLLCPLHPVLAQVPTPQRPSPPAPRPAAAATPATSASTVPTTASALTAADPASVLRGGSVTQAERDEAARRVLMQHTPASRKVILAALSDASNRDAQLSAARAIALDSDPDRSFINPLFDLIGQPRTTDAGIQALANFRTAPEVARRLVALATDRQQREATRVAAIRAVGSMPNKPAARTLMDLFNAEAEPASIHGAAAAALSDLTGSSLVRSDPAFWQKWWAENEPKADAQFERDLLDARSARLLRLQNRFERFANEQRTILEELYQRAAERDKEPILLRYLRSSEPETRALGARLVADDFKQTRPITPAVRDQLRAMVADNASQVRIAVAQTLLLLNDAQALDALLAQLAREPDPDVRMEIARALQPMRDRRVIEPLVKLLRDPSPAVAEVAARALASSDDLAPLIRNDPQLANLVAAELSQALARASGAGNTSLRAAIIDAMGALRSTNLRKVYNDLLMNPREPVAVRRAALRALGQYGKQTQGDNWPANDIAESLYDPDDGIRQEAVRALRNTADFGNASQLYELMQKDPNRNVRDESWGVLRNLFTDASAPNIQLAQYADRFKGDPEKRIEVLKVLAQRLSAAKDEEQLAAQQQNLGAEYMQLATRAAQRTDLDAEAREQAVIDNAEQADKYFDLALKHYRGKDPTDQGMATSNLIELRMDALLVSRQYKEAADFAAACIAANSQNMEAVGRKISAAADQLLQQKRLDEALQLIDSAKRMNPPLLDPGAAIERIEAKIREQMQNQPAVPTSGDNLTTPRSAVGSGQ